MSEQKEKEKLQKERLKYELFEKERELLTHSLMVSQQKEVLTKVHSEVSQIANSKDPRIVANSINKLNYDLKTKIDLNNDWEHIKLHFEKVHPEFFTRLKADFPVLTNTDLKICAYTKIKLSIKEISRLLNVNPKSVQVSRSRLKKKMSLQESISIDDFIASID